MKKVLLIGLILAICVLVFPQGVLADIDSAVVNANIKPSVNFVVTNTMATDWALEPTGFTTAADAIKYNVISNSPWNVKISTVTPADGKMLPTVGALPSLAKVLEIERLPSGAFTPVISGLEILSYDVTPELGTDYWTDLKQETVFDDSRLTSGVYKITLEFTIIQNA